MNLRDLAHDLKQALNPTITAPSDNAETQISTFNESVSSVMNDHAPMRTILLKGSNWKPWYTDEIHEARRKRRQYERQYRKSHCEVHKQLLSDQRKEVARLIDKSKSTYYQERLMNSNTKETFSIINGLLGTKTMADSVGSSDPQSCAESFGDFFNSKITKIRQELDNNQEYTELHDDLQTPDDDKVLSSFNIQTPESLIKIIRACPSKSCSLDPIPTSLLKDPEILNALLPTIANLVNCSLSSSTVPKQLKTAQIKPSLKKPGLDITDQKNYRPISNLPFLAKLLEKVVALHLKEHLKQHKIHDMFQSAYRSGHSTETAMIKIKSDIGCMLDKGESALLVLLDLSAAFDTIDHQILLHRLENLIGIKGAVLSWLSSYLQERQQYVQVDDMSSSMHALRIGVPQGSVLGPLLFLLYVLPLSRIFSAHDISHHGYADDTQIYCSLPSRDSAALWQTIARVESCLNEVRNWMCANKLKLNDEKTECIVFTSRANSHFITAQNIHLTMGAATIKPSLTVRSLGAHLDSTLSMEKQVACTVKTAYYHLRRIAKIRCHLTQSACTKAVIATVTSRLDYQNGLLSGITDRLLHKLQVLQNHAARLITNTPNREHIQPVLHQLHWLPVKYRIDYKLLTMIHQTLNSSDAPGYLKDMLVFYEPSRELRSSNCTKLFVPKMERSIGERTFHSYAPKLWNLLPLNLRNIHQPALFKKHLKTFLFISAF